MARSKKPISLNAARKKKPQKPQRVHYQLPEGDDWKPDGWDQLWQMLYRKALPYMLEYVRARQEQAA